MSSIKRRRTTLKTAARKANRKGAAGFKRKATTAVVPGRTRAVGGYARTMRPQVEKKFLDYTVPIGTFISHDGHVIPSLNLVGSGPGQSQRVGRQITVTNLNFHGGVRLSNYQRTELEDARQSSARVRVIFYLDKQCNGSPATADDIIRNAGSSTYHGDGFRELDQAARFEILKDKTYDMNSLITMQATFTDPELNVIQLGQVERKCNFSHVTNTPIVFSNSAGDPDVSNVKTNNFGILIFKIGIEAHVEFYGVARIKYTDQ